MSENTSLRQGLPPRPLQSSGSLKRHLATSGSNPLSKANSGGPPMAQTPARRTPQDGQPPSSGRERSRGAPGSRTTPLRSDSGEVQGTQDLETVYISVVETRSKEIGVALFGMRSCELQLYQYSDNSSLTYTTNMISHHQPFAVLLENKAGIQDNLIQFFLEEHSPSTQVIPIARKYFSDTKGVQYLRVYMIQEYSSAEMDLSSKNLATAAAAALLKYLELSLKVHFAANSIKVIFRSPKGRVLIDASTATNLELLKNSRTGSKKDSVFGIINYTRTIGGARLLRSTLLQPLNDIDAINLRHACIHELTQRENEPVFMKHTVGEALKSFYDVDSILAKVSIVPQFNTPKAVQSGLRDMVFNVILYRHTFNLNSSQIKLREIVESLPFLSDILSTLESDLISQMREHFTSGNLDELGNCLRRFIREESTFGGNPNSMTRQYQQCFAIKEGFDQLLDVARTMFSEAVNDVYILADHISAEYNLDIKVLHTDSRGYYLSIATRKRKSNEEIPLPENVFIQCTFKQGKCLCTTEDIVSLNSRITETLNEIYMISQRILGELHFEVLKHVTCLFSICESISLLDVLYSFASVVIKNDAERFIKPQLTQDGPLAIENGRHLLLESKLEAGKSVTANNAYLSDGCNFQIVTGPNMSGKTTYLKTVSLIVLLAHTGCFVPATFASIGTIDRLFTRLGTGDSIEGNASTFMLEMKEMARVVQSCTERSLVVVDELGRGTASIDGVGIAWALSEYLLHLRPFTLFATHHFELTQLESMYNNVKNLHMMVSTMDDHLSFLFSVGDGTSSQRTYGIQLAKLAGLPDEFLEIAKNIQKDIRSKKSVPTSKESQHHTLRAEICARLAMLKKSSLDDDSIVKYLRHLRSQTDLQE